MLRPVAVVAKSVTRRTLETFLKEEAPTYEAFCAKLRVVSKEGKSVAFVLNEVQRLRAARRTRLDVILKARQQGVTTEELARDLWHFLTRPNAGVVILCQSGNEHKALDDVAKKFGDLVRSLEEQGVDIPWRGKPSATYWELETGAILTIGEAGASAAAAAKKGRAGTLSRLHCTELAYWEYAGETWNAILECLPEGGDAEIVIESTPNGSAPNVARDKRDIKHAAGSALFYWLYQDAKDDSNGFRAHFFAWFTTLEYSAPLPEDVPFEAADDEERWLLERDVTPEQIQWRRNKLKKKDADTFAQEYPKDDLTCFLVSGRTFFDKPATRALFLKCVPPVHTVQIRGSGAVGEVRFWRFCDRAQTYVISADTSEGTGGDPCAAHVYERVTSRHMATLDGQLKPVVFAKWLAWLGKAFGVAILAVERNNHGHAVLLALAEIEKYPRIFCDRDEEPGWMTHATTRTPALDKLEDAHRTGIWKPRDVKIVEQLPTFVVDDHNKAAAARGAHDEHPICGAIGLDLLTRPGVARGVGTAPILPF